MTSPAIPDPNRVLIFDTTLRDGEQSPGASMNLPEKLEIARTLEALGVDIIEAGFPVASPDDFAAVKAIAEQTTRARICALARALTGDIDRAAEAVRPAGARARIHIFLATSAIHRQFKLNKVKEEIVKQARDSVAYARTLCDDIEFSPEDASRTEPEFLAEVVQAVIAAGARTVNIPDTVGYAYPNDYADLITYLRAHVANIDQAVISVHCHNDLGLAVANSLAAVRAGARQVECTINGIGERAGNCSLEEVVMAMRVRKDMFAGITTGITSSHLYGASRLVQSITGLTVQRNKAVVGDNAFAHESGIHQHGMMKNPECYEIMTPQSVGVPDTNLVLGKHSGRAALGARLTKLGMPVGDDDLGKVFEAFKRLADRKKEIYDGDLIALIEEVVRGTTLSVWKLDYLHTSAGTEAIATATVRLSKDGTTVTDAATGDGPVDAVVKVLQRICGVSAAVEDYRLRAVTKGGDAQGEVSMRVRVVSPEAPDGVVVGGKGLSTDIVQASCLAYLDAINRSSYLIGRLDYRVTPTEEGSGSPGVRKSGSRTA
ncbi:MAG: 2-isopropylmalate synthase [Planctomycetes bacterium]|nr:2-isopropylmalate synthase [Planctomycetota bacterium]